MPQQILQNLSSNTAEDPRTLAPQALQAAFEWCQAVLTREQFTESFDALTGIGEFSIALTEGLDCLSMLDPTLKFSEAGKNIEDRIYDGKRKMTVLLKGLGELESKSTVLREEENKIRKLESKTQELQDLVKRLERAPDLEKHINDLQKQVEMLDINLPTANRIKDLEHELTDAAQPLIVLSREQLSKLDINVKELLKELEGAQKKRDDLVKEILKLKSQIGAFDESEESFHRALESYKEANRAVTRELPAAQKVSDLLAQAERCLRQSDVALKVLIEANEQAKKLPELSFSGGNA